jgi:putative membrane protein
MEMKKYAVMGAASLVAYGYSSLAWAQQVDPFCRSPMMWGDGWYGWFLGPVMMIFFLAIAVAVVVLIVRWLGGTRHGGSAMASVPAQKPAIDILKDRFAHGEIDKEEFEEKRRILEE